jgi:hypothetical protein
VIGQYSFVTEQLQRLQKLCHLGKWCFILQQFYKFTISQIGILDSNLLGRSQELTFPICMPLRLGMGIAMQGYNNRISFLQYRSCDVFT